MCLSEWINEWMESKILIICENIQWHYGYNQINWANYQKKTLVLFI